MKYSCIQDNNYNFTIDYRDDYIIYTDHSKWLGQSDSDTAYTLKVYNGDTFKEFKVFPNRSIIIPYTDLPSNCNDPINCNFDGIYKFQATACSNTQVYEKTESILISIYKVYNKLVTDTLECSDKDMSNLIEIFSYIKGIEAYGKENRTEKALELYNLLLKILKKQNCNCNG